MPDNRLHDTDFYSWTRQQADALRAVASGVKSNAVDWENVIEEIESLGSEQEHALESHLINILVHLLKLDYSPAIDPRRHWREEVGTQRVRFEKRLRKNPGLKSKLNALFTDAYADARQEAAIKLERDGLSLADLPEHCPYSLEQTRDMNWFPVGRAGNERVKD
jgi:hypothetical protein